jgi:hypothetical protein
MKQAATEVAAGTCFILVSCLAYSISQTILTHGAEPFLEEPIVQPLKNFPAFYGTRRFKTVFTRALHWSLS